MMRRAHTNSKKVQQVQGTKGPSEAWDANTRLAFPEKSCQTCGVLSLTLDKRTIFLTAVATYGTQRYNLPSHSRMQRVTVTVTVTATETMKVTAMVTTMVLLTVTEMGSATVTANYMHKAANHQLFSDIN